MFFSSNHPDEISQKSCSKLTILKLLIARIFLNIKNHVNYFLVY